MDDGKGKLSEGRARNPIKTSKISSAIVGAAGEHYVISQLLRRGWIAALAPDGVPNMDILVTDENNRRLCATQVKTGRNVGRTKGWVMNRKQENLIVDDLFYVLVDVGKKPSDRTTCYVLPSIVVADCIRRCHRVWLETPGRGGRSHKDSPVRELRLDHSFIKAVSEKGRTIIDRYGAGWLEPYRENWSILELPDAAGY